MKPATKTCPACQATALLYANVCDQCGRQFPVQAFPEADTVSEALTEPVQDTTLTGLLMKRTQLGICLLGAIMVIAGVFMPLLGNDTGFGTITLMKTYEGPVLIGVGLIAAVCASLRKFTGVAVLGSGTLTFLSTWLMPIWRYTRAHPNSGDAASEMLQVRYGWLVLILAGVLMILGGGYDLIQRPADPEERRVTDRKRVPFLLSCLAGVGATVLLLMCLHTLRRVPASPQTSEQSPPNSSTPIDRSQ